MELTRMHCRPFLCIGLDCPAPFRNLGYLKTGHLHRQHDKPEPSYIHGGFSVDQMNEDSGDARVNNLRALPDDGVHLHRTHHDFAVYQVGIQFLSGRIIKGFKTSG